MPVKAELLGGALVLSGRIDLVLGLPDQLEPTRATRLAVDLKSGGAYPEFAEDKRFYALVHDAAVRGATLSGGLVVLRDRAHGSPRTSPRSCSSTLRIAWSARLVPPLVWRNGREPELTPGSYCVWCPRASTCPVAELPAVAPAAFAAD